MTTSSIQPEHVGMLARCPTCKRVAVIEDVRPDQRIILRHNAIHWCVIAPPNAHLVERFTDEPEGADASG